MNQTRKEKPLDGLLLHICEVCGRTEVLTPQEAFDKGWDYPPMMGRFGVVSPRTCPNCLMVDTAWAAMVLHGKSLNELTDRQKKAVERIIGEPKSIMLPREV